MFSLIFYLQLVNLFCMVLFCFKSLFFCLFILVSYPIFISQQVDEQIHELFIHCKYGCRPSSSGVPGEYESNPEGENNLLYYFKSSLLNCCFLLHSFVFPTLYHSFILLKSLHTTYLFIYLFIYLTQITLVSRHIPCICMNINCLIPFPFQVAQWKSSLQLECNYGLSERFCKLVFYIKTAKNSQDIIHDQSIGKNPKTHSFLCKINLDFILNMFTFK